METIILLIITWCLVSLVVSLVVGRAIRRSNDRFINTSGDEASFETVFEVESQHAA